MVYFIFMTRFRVRVAVRMSSSSRRLQDAAGCRPQETMLEEEGRHGRLHPRTTLRSLKLWIWRGSFGLFVFGVPSTPATPDPKFSTHQKKNNKKKQTPKQPSFTLCEYTSKKWCCHITALDTLVSSTELCLGGKDCELLPFTLLKMIKVLALAY